MASLHYINELRSEDSSSDQTGNLSNRSKRTATADFDGSFLEYTHYLEKETAYWRELACRDDLTGLPNRRKFKIIIDSYLHRADREKKKVIFFYLDINKFKYINDTYGHNVGDEILKELGNRLQSLSAADEVFHFSGDEFVIVHRLQNGISVQMEAIESVCKEPFQTTKGKITAGVSIGAGVYPDDSSNVRTLLDMADSAMFEAKRSGTVSKKFTR